MTNMNTEHIKNREFVSIFSKYWLTRAQLASKLAIILCIAFLMQSCEPDIVDEFTPIKERWQSVEDFTANVSTSKKYQINNAQDEFVVETPSALLRFSANSIVDSDENPITGDVTLEFTNIKNSGELILNDIHTYTISEDILHSENVYNIRLFQNGEELGIVNPIYIYVQEQAQILDQKWTFYWETEVTNFEIGWFTTIAIDIQSYDWDFTVDGSNYASSGYKMTVHDTGWFSVAKIEDELYDQDSDFSEVQIELPEEFMNGDTKAYIAYNDVMTLINLEKSDSKFVNKRILKAAEVEVVIISTIDDNLYFGKKHFIVGENNMYKITPAEIDYLTLVNELKGL